MHLHPARQQHIPIPKPRQNTGATPIDVLMLHDKIYGRETQVQYLLETYRSISRTSTVFVQLVGASGIGKTAIAQEFRRRLEQKDRKPIFVRCKFEQFHRSQPLKAIIQGLDQTLQGLDPCIELAALLEEQIDDDLPNQERLHKQLSQWIQGLSTPQQPLVLLLDDLHWADPASLQLIRQLMSQQSALMVVALYREQGIHPNHALRLTIQKLQKKRIPCPLLAIDPLPAHDLIDWISELFGEVSAQTQALVQFVEQLTRGNPFFTKQLLLGLYRHGQLSHDAATQRWKYDLEQIRHYLNSSNLIEFLAHQLETLADETQLALQLSACLGNQFQLNELARVYGASMTVPKTLNELETLLQPAVQQQFLIALKPQEYRFAHDRIQQATCLLLPNVEGQTVDETGEPDWAIAQVLLSNLPVAGRESQVFEIVDQLDPSWNLIQDPHRQIKLTQLNLVAGRRARVNQDYAGAIRYFTRGLEWLPHDAWNSHYELTLDLHEAAAEAEYRHTNFFRAASLAETILEHAKTLRDQAKAQEIRIRLHLAAAQHPEALTIGLDFLQQLGLPLQSSRRNQTETQVLSVAALEQLPMMTHGEHLLQLRILSLLVLPCLEAKPALLNGLSQTMLKLTEQSGLSRYAAVAYSIQAMLQQHTPAAEQAIWILNQLNAQEIRGQTLLLIYGRIYIWQTPLEDVQDVLAETIQVSLESGELEAAAQACLHYCTYRFLSGLPLQIVTTDYQRHQETLELLQQALPSLLNQAFQRLIYALQDPNRTTWDLPQRTRLAQEAHSGSLLSSIQFMEALAQGILYFLGRKVRAALQQLCEATQHQAPMMGLLPEATRVFYSALTLLALCRQVDNEQLWPLLHRADQYQDCLYRWQKQAPKNFQHQWELVVAERARTLHQPSRAIEYYERAIASADAQNYHHDLALAYELAGEFYLDTHQPQLARVYLQQAHQAYCDWGALAKAAALQRTYAALMTPERPLQVIETHSEIISLGNLLPTEIETSSSSNSATLTHILQATRPLFPATASWDELLSTMLRAIASLIPARRIVLFLPNRPLLRESSANSLGHASDRTIDQYSHLKRPSSPQWNLEVWAHRPTVQTPELTLHRRQYKTPGVLSDLISTVQEAATTGRPCLRKPTDQPTQLFLPLGYPHPLGVLYLDAFPSLTFTDYQQQILELIGQQSAIALAHAKAQVSLEHNVQQRTQELHDEISERRHTENKLAQQLKRAELLESITRKIRESLHPEEIFQSAAHSIGTALQASRCVIHHYDLAHSELHLPLIAEYLGTGNKSIRAHLPPIDRNPYIQTLLEHDNVVAASNVYAHSMDNEARIFCLRTELKSLLAVKTFYKGQANGIIVLHQCNRFRSWSNNEVELLEALADPVGIALAQAQLVEAEQRQRKEFEQAKAKAEETSQSKGQFIANLGHELRTPLTAILGYGRLLGQDAKLGLKHQHMVQTITHSGEHLLKLVEDVMAMAKLEAGRATLTVDTLDLAHLLESLRDVFFLQMTLKGLQFLLQIDPMAPCYIRADGGKLRQILMNLLGNAVKFTVEGSVTVRVSTKREAMVLEDVGENWEFLCFEVEDTGPGIAPKDIDRLFQDFEQTEVGRRADVGTGLGLSISRKLVELMGGEISVESEPLVKTIFRFHVLVERLSEEQFCLQSGENARTISVQASQAMPQLTAESLNHLPVVWVERLHQATLLLDQEALFQLLDELPSEQSALRNALAQLVHQFAYEAILELTRAPFQT